MRLPSFADFLSSFDDLEVMRRMMEINPTAPDLVEIPPVTSPDFQDSVELYVEEQTKKTVRQLMVTLELYHEWLQQQVAGQ